MNNLDFNQLLFRINKLHTENTNNNIKEYNVTRSDMSFLVKLNQNKSSTQKELAESRNLNNATVTRALERLEKKGFVERLDDERDKRKKLVSLTPEGKNTVEIILNKHEEFKKEIFNNFSENEYETILKLLYKLLLSLENYE